MKYVLIIWFIAASSPNDIEPIGYFVEETKCQDALELWKKVYPEHPRSSYGICLPVEEMTLIQ